MNYTTQSLIENFLGRSLTAEEASLLQYILDTVDSWINDQIGSSFDASPSESIRYFDGGSKIIEVDDCIEITAVNQVDQYEAVQYAYEVDADYEARPRNDTIKTWIEKRSGKFPYGTANIAITAKFSRGAVPNDIVYLATVLAGSLFQASEAGNLQKESIEGYSYELKEFSTQNERISIILDKYTRDTVLI